MSFSLYELIVDHLFILIPRISHGAGSFNRKCIPVRPVCDAFSYHAINHILLKIIRMSELHEPHNSRLPEPCHSLQRAFYPGPPFEIRPWAGCISIYDQRSNQLETRSRNCSHEVSEINAPAQRVFTV